MKIKRLIPAVAMLLVSAMLLGTSTFAWFAMNRTVTAEQMAITATSANPYLVISETENGTFDLDANAMVLEPAANTALKLVTPLNVASNVAYYADGTAKTNGTTTDPSKFTNAASVLWGTTGSSDPAQVEASNVTTLVPTAELGQYVQKSELWFKVLTTDTNGLGANLKCTKVTFTSGTNSIAASGRVLLVSEEGKYQLFKLVDGVVTAAETGSDTALIAQVNGTAQKVTAYFYFDGTDASAYTNNATDLTGVTAQFEFKIDE